MRTFAVLLFLAACSEPTDPYTNASVTIGTGGSEGRISTGVRIGDNVTIGGSVGAPL